MKRLISFFSLLVALSVNAQVIHWITFIDTTDPEVGECDKKGRQVLYSRFVNVVNGVLADKGYSSDIHDYYDDLVSPQNCKNIVFYYIGHGAHGIGDSNPFPQMKLGSNDEKMFIPLQWVHNQLKSKNPTLLVTIGMCCNSFEEAFAKEGPLFSVDYGSGYYYTETEKQAIQELFLGYTGDIIATSASPGQRSKGASSKRFGEMDMFTTLFIIHFEEGAAEGELEWNTLLNNVSERVNYYRNGKQTPFHLCNLRKKDYSNIGTSSQDPDQELFNKLNEGFAKLLDRKVSLEDRKAQIPTVLSLFSPNAVIKRIEKDNKTATNPLSPEKYLSRIVHNSLLVDVIPIRDSIKRSSDNKISMLKVKEVTINK